MVIHTVKAGETAYSIAAEYGVSPELLIENNDIPNPERLVAGQTLVVLIPNSTYTVSSGDSLYSIARAYGISVNTLLRNNPSLMGGSSLMPGDTLVISYDGQSPDNPTLAVNGYVYPSVSRTTLMRTLPYTTFITPFTYGFTAEGDLVAPEDGAIINEALSYGALPVMLLSTLNSDGNFDNVLASMLLNDTELQDTLIDNLVAVLNTKGYRGLDIDFEFIFPEDTDEYVAFVQRVKDRLTPLGLQTWVALAPKTSADQRGLLYEAHDYGRLGAIADKVLLMTYEWGYTYGPAMAVAPLDKVREVLEYALTEIPAEKIFLGIPNYGYDFTLPYVQGESRARSLSNTAAVSLADEKGVPIMFEEGSESPYFRYTENGVEHEVRFEDARSIAAKLALAADNGIYGVGYWNFMNYFPANFLVLNGSYNIAGRS